MILLIAFIIQLLIKNNAVNTFKILPNIAHKQKSHKYSKSYDIIEDNDENKLLDGIKSVTSSIQQAATKSSTNLQSAMESASSTAASNLQSIKKGTERNSKEVIRWIDNQAKNGTSIVGTKTKSMILQFTNKTSYEFGDVSKEILRRLTSQDNSIQDTIVLLKLFVTISASITPLAKVLPIAILLDALNFSLEKKIGGELLQVLASSLDERFTAAIFTSDDTFALGDFAKRSVINAISKFTGKEQYESGDIKNAVEQQMNDNNYDIPKLEFKLDGSNSEFEQWDKAFIQSHPDSDDIIATNNNMDRYDDDVLLKSTVDDIIRSEFDEWDAMFQEKYSS